MITERVTTGTEVFNTEVIDADDDVVVLHNTPPRKETPKEDEWLGNSGGKDAGAEELVIEGDYSSRRSTDEDEGLNISDDTAGIESSKGEAVVEQEFNIRKPIWSFNTNHPDYQRVMHMIDEYARNSRITVDDLVGACTIVQGDPKIHPNNLLRLFEGYVRDRKFNDVVFIKVADALIELNQLRKSEFSLYIDLPANQDSPLFHYIIEKIRFIFQDVSIQQVTDLVKKGEIRFDKIKKTINKIIEMCKDVDVERDFVVKLEKASFEADFFEPLFELEDKLISLGRDSDWSVVTKDLSLDKDTLHSLLNLYNEGRKDPYGCKEKIQSALNFA